MDRQTRLWQLEKHLHQLRTQAAAVVDREIYHGRFDRQLFRSRGTRLQDYLRETEQHYAQLLQERQTARAAWLAEKIVNQIAALQRELATLNLRRTASPGWLHHEIVRHEEFVRRLRAMVTERESAAQQADLLADQQRLMRETDALRARLERCQLALNALLARQAAERAL